VNRFTPGQQKLGLWVTAPPRCSDTARTTARAADSRKFLRVPISRLSGSRLPSRNSGASQRGDRPATRAAARQALDATALRSHPRPPQAKSPVLLVQESVRVLCSWATLRLRAPSQPTADGVTAAVALRMAMRCSIKALPGRDNPCSAAHRCPEMRRSSSGSGDTAA
jgi:hypothetical protein